MTAQINKGRAALLLIAGIPVVIILASSWLWYYVASGRLDLVDMLGTANQGSLISPPLALTDMALRDELNQPFQVPAGPPLWRILILGDAACEAEACRELVYYTRQIHTAMGKYSNRIERLYIAPGGQPDTPGLQALVEDYPKLKVLYTSPPDVGLLKDQAVSGTPAYFVVDPVGWVILGYAADADGKDIMADLKFLIKNSG